MVSRTDFVTGIKHFIGTTEEKTALSTTGLVPFSTFYDTTAKAGYTFDGADWQPVTLTFIG